MLLAAVISLFSATLVLAVVDCFFKKHKTISILLQLLTLTSLFCASIALVHYKNAYSLFNALLILSIVPQFFTLVDLKSIVNHSKNKELKAKIGQTNGFLIKSLCLFVSSVILSVCGLILGLETIYLYLLAIAIAACAIFAMLAYKKKINIFNLLSYIFSFLAAALATSQILTVLLYSTSLKNILYSAAMLLYAAYSIISVSTRFKYSNLIYILSLLTALSPILFL